MADYDGLRPGEILADTSVAEFISNLGLGIAAAQADLDNNALRQLELYSTPREDLDNRSLFDLGMTPSFYHFEHADISCSMQIKLKVGKKTEFGVAANFGYNNTSNDNQSSSNDRSESESGSRREEKKATYNMVSKSNAVISISGKQFTPNGTTPLNRLKDLKRLLKADTALGIENLLITPPNQALSMTLDPARNDSLIVVSSPRVTFNENLVARALIRVGENSDTTYTIKTGTEVTTTAQASVHEYAEHVKSQMEAAGYQTELYHPVNEAQNRVGFSLYHDTDHQEPKKDEINKLALYAQFLIELDEEITIHGYTDSMGSESHNEELGKERIKWVKQFLIGAGFPSNKIVNEENHGERDAVSNTGQEVENQDWRKVEIILSNLSDHLIKIEGDIDKSVAAPKDGAQSNRFEVFFDAQSLQTNPGDGINIEGTDFDFDGSAVDGNSANSALAYAINLTNAINANANLSASRMGPQVTVSRATDTYQVQLLARSSRNLAIQNNSDIQITEQFSRSTRSSSSSSSSENTSVAVGVSIQARFARQFNMEVTGNSRISARLAAVPPPDGFNELLQQLNEENRS